MKKLKYLLFLVSLMFMGMISANAIGANGVGEIKTICNIGSTDGLLYPNQWKFVITEHKKSSLGSAPPMGEGIFYEFEYGKVYICPSTGCVGNEYSGRSNGVLKGKTAFPVPNLKEDQLFANIGEGNGYIATDSLIEMVGMGQCPKYVYAASNKSAKKIGFIFSNSKVNNAKKIFEANNYVVEFETKEAEAEEGTNLTKVSKENYEKHVQKMKNNIQQYKDKDWANVYSEECGTTFGKQAIKENILVEYYEKYRTELFKVDSSYNFSDGDNTLSEFSKIKCASKPAASSNNSSKLKIELESRVGCGVITPELKDWLIQLLDIIKIIALVLTLIMGMLDFFKGMASNEADAMKKVWKNFSRRLIAVALLFLVPVIIEFILGLVTINGVDASSPLCGIK